MSEPASQFSPEAQGTSNEVTLNDDAVDRQAMDVFVDLDGTLVRTDLLYEAAFRFVKRNPLNVLRLLIWVMQGKLTLKTKLAEAERIDPAALPYNRELIDYLQHLRDRGYKLHLATASHIVFARAVAEHLGLFESVLATDANTNLKGHNKLAQIKRATAGQPFIYAGDSRADIPIWRDSQACILVNVSPSVQREVEQSSTILKAFERPQSVAKAALREARIHQWAKNALIFVPLITAHGYSDPANIALAFIGFLSFSLTASGIYFLNDLLDLDADRQHKTKSRRPLASGDLPLPFGLIGFALLIVIGLTLAFAALSLKFFLVLLAYVAITTAYSFYLKRKSTIDVMTLALLYTVRIVAGAVAIDVSPSSWLIGFSIFVFASLAYLKRYIEIVDLNVEQGSATGRGYSRDDIEATFTLGVSNMTASVLVLALFVSSDYVAELYRTPELLWGLCFLMLYWGNRVWLGARRRKINEDPVVFALRDRVSQVIGVLFLLIVLASRYGEF